MCELPCAYLTSENKAFISVCMRIKRQMVVVNIERKPFSATCASLMSRTRTNTWVASCVANNVCFENWRTQSSSWMDEPRWWEFTREQTTSKPLLSSHPRENMFSVVLICFFFCFQPIKSFALALLVFSRASRGSRWPGVLSIMSDQPRNDGTTISNRLWPTWRNDSCHFLSTEEKKGNEPVCQNGTASISVPSVRPIRDHLCRWSWTSLSQGT